MFLRGGALSHPKRGNSINENEDAHYSMCIGDKELHGPVVCAVADGATETSYSALWANLLVEAYVDVNGDELRFQSQLADIRRRWDETVRSKPLPWYAEEKVAKGAFATLLGVVITPASSQAKWRAVAIGDSCLFHVRNHELQTVFPISSGQQLCERPALLSSNTAAQGTFSELARFTEGDLTIGDRLYLVTDALAGWIFSNLDNGSKPFESIEEMLGMLEAFPSWLGHHWDTGSLKNDDCTILWIEAVA